MSTREGIGGENEAVDHKEPREEQVPLPSHRQPLGARNGRPGRKGASHAIGVAEHAGRIELMTQDCRDAPYLTTFSLHRPD